MYVFYGWLLLINLQNRPPTFFAKLESLEACQKLQKALNREDSVCVEVENAYIYIHEGENATH